MSKKLIRLTEGDLHRIIKESVNNILSEMDWKTYMNAAKARQEQGNYKSSDKLMKHAQQQFNKKHGLNDYGQMFGKEGHDMRFQLGLNNGTVKGCEGNDNKSSYETYIADNGGWAMNRIKGGYEWTSGYSGNSMQYYNQLGKASGDMQRYYSDYGKTPYFKGKGWMD